jgi:membrane-bound serine protease (ClpP class)
MSIQPNRLATAALLACGAWLTVSAQSPGGGVYVLAFQDAISPGSSHYITSGIDQAVAADAALVIIEMDTPGGLDSSMREINQAILDSPVPIASLVYPLGARAASAGAYIMYASHIAAMAPATSMGACTPVAIGGSASGSPDEADDGAGRDPVDPQPDVGFAQPATTMERKAINDAVAHIRGLAELRGRNADWAETCVRASVSLSAEAALDQGVIDLIATDRSDLIRQLNGRIIDGERLDLPATTLVTVVEADWRTRFLSVISNPNVAIFLLSAGIFGLILEGYNPGAIVPGVVGAICLLVATYALQILPVNYAGLALMLLGLILMVAEFFVASFGALGIGGIAAFVFGALILFDTEIPGFDVASSVIGSIAFSGALAVIGTIWLALKARDRRVVSGIEEMTGLPAEALENFDGAGQVWVHGERWQAHTTAPVTKGQSLTVKKVDGLVLQVEPAADKSH